MTELDKSKQQLDATGLVCPEPVMLLHNRIRDLPAGGQLEVLATDPSTQRDIPKFCQFLGHRLEQQETVETDEQKTLYRYLIRKKEG